MNHELPDVQARFRKGRGTRDQIANIRWIIEKARAFQKNIYFCLIDYAKQSLWLCGSQQTVENSERDGMQTTWPASWAICTQVRKQQLELDMEQQTGSKLGKECIRDVYCHPAYLIHMKSTSSEKAMAPHSGTLAWKIPWTEEPGRLQSIWFGRVRQDWASSLSLFTFHFHTLEKEMATHSSVLAWRIPGMGEPGGLPSMGLHRVGHNWSELTAAAAAEYIMWNAGLDESQAWIKISRRYINNLRYADYTTLMAESKEEL